MLARPEKPFVPRFYRSLPKTAQVGATPLSPTNCARTVTPLRRRPDEAERLSLQTLKTRVAGEQTHLD